MGPRMDSWLRGDTYVRHLHLQTHLPTTLHLGVASPCGGVDWPLGPVGRRRGTGERPQRDEQMGESLVDWRHDILALDGIQIRLPRSKRT